MKRYCIGLFFIIFVGITIIPAFYFYAMNNMAHTDIFTRPGWMYGLALLTSIVAAGLCEMRSVHDRKKV